MEEKGETTDGWNGKGPLLEDETFDKVYKVKVIEGFTRDRGGRQNEWIQNTLLYLSCE